MHRTPGLTRKTAKEEDGAWRASSVPERLEQILGRKPNNVLQKLTKGKASEFNTKSPIPRKTNDPETISNAHGISLESSVESWLTCRALKEMTKYNLLLLSTPPKPGKYSFRDALEFLPLKRQP